MRLGVSKVVIVSAIGVLFAAQAVSQAGKQPVVGSKHQAAKPGTSSKSKSKSHRRSRKGAWKRHGQQTIQPERANAIQEALIREKYLSGEPTGKWDERSQAAMARYQADNGWQAKVTPDSRALIKLGLGPNYSEKEMLLMMPKSSSDPVAATAAGAVPSKQR